MKRMLINATQPEEVRVAIADGQFLLDLDIEVPAQEQKKSNIYKGRITRVEPSLDACFVEFGSERHGFLSIREINREYFTEVAREQMASGQKPDIREALQAGQEVIVQVEKEERGSKGAALTTFISLAGRYLVLMPNNPRAGGVSRQISRDDRKELLDALKLVDVPEDMGLIVRTAGVGRDEQELQWDLNYLTQLWAAIKTAADARSAPFLIYQESKLIIRALRDYLREDIGEILIDDEQVFEDAREFMQQVMPHNLRKLKYYRDAVPLFSRYQIESQIESAFSREVRLPSGGALVIDHTEALLSIDINSARATKGADIEETALHTNLEAADEIARQLRIRDLGGLIVIDFIDMLDKDAQRQVENRLREAMRIDKARVQIGRISRFGLLEMSRQRLRPSLGESSYQTCPRCDGQGSIRSIESLALAILRLAEEEAMKDFTARVLVHAPVPVANFLLNEKRLALSDIEQRNKLPVTVVANNDLETPRFTIQRLRAAENNDEPSYALAIDPEVEAQTGYLREETAQTSNRPAEQAAVAGVRPDQPAPQRQPQPQRRGFWSRLIAWFAGLGKGGNEEPRSKAAPSEANRQRSDQRKGHYATSRRQHQSKKADQPDGGSNKPTQEGGKQGGKQGSRKTGKKAGNKSGKKTARKTARKSEHNDQTVKPGEGHGGGDAAGTQEPPDGDAQRPPRKKRRRRGGKKRSRKTSVAQGETSNREQTGPDSTSPSTAATPEASKPVQQPESASQPGPAPDRQPTADRDQAQSGPDPAATADARQPAQAKPAEDTPPVGEAVKGEQGLYRLSEEK